VTSSAQTSQSKISNTIENKLTDRRTSHRAAQRAMANKSMTETAVVNVSVRAELDNTEANFGNSGIQQGNMQGVGCGPKQTN
jgi:hypothetical protein